MKNKQIKTVAFEEWRIFIFNYSNMYSANKHMKCPGQNPQFWKPEDIFEVTCSSCKNDVEFFKDDISRICEKCGRKIMNPGKNSACAEHCEYADKCLID